MSRFIRFFMVCCLLALGVSLLQAQDDPIYAIDIDPHFAVDWMQLLYDRIEAESISAPAASRMYAYAGITLYEAVLHGIPGNNTLAGQITHMPDLPYPDEVLTRVEDPFNLDWASVANAALSEVLPGLFYNGSDETLEAITALRDKQKDVRIEELGEERVENSMTYGEALAEVLNEWIAEDGFADTREMNGSYEMPTGADWMYVLTTDGTKPVEPYWGMIRPFIMEYSDECAVQQNMYFSTEKESTFYAQALEVKEVGDNLTDEQKAIARFWVDTPGQTGTPAGHWVMIENQLVDQLNLRLDQTAMMYAMVGMAVGDSFISCWSLKYQVMLLRPESYIKANIRRAWSPYIQTPPFPEYPSGHSVVSAAAADVLTAMFGTVAFTDGTHVSRGEAPRFFTSFEAAADEAAISRLYGGIHYRAAIENGMRQGRCVADRIMSNVILSPVSQGGE